VAVVFLLIAQNFPFLLRGALKRGHWPNVWGEPDTPQFHIETGFPRVYMYRILA